MIDNCLYKIERETLRKRGLSSVQRVNAVHKLRVILTRLKYKGVIQS